MRSAPTHGRVIRTSYILCTLWVLSGNTCSLESISVIGTVATAVARLVAQVPILIDAHFICFCLSSRSGHVLVST